MANVSTTRRGLQHLEDSRLSSSVSISVEKLSPNFLVNKHEAARILGVSPETLKKYRQRGKLIEGIHYYRWNSRTIRYNSALLKDWAVNRNDSAALNRGIEAFLKSLLSNQSKRRGRQAQS